MNKRRVSVLAIILVLIVCACRQTTAVGENAERPAAKTGEDAQPRHAANPPAATAGRVIHVLVALCDNQYQGIVPVPPRIGNGDDPANNLYWGAAFGVKTFFKRSTDWVVVPAASGHKAAILERIVFKHRREPVFLVADAYRGREIKQCTVDLLAFAAGKNAESIEIAEGSRRASISAGGGAELIAYVGHDGLMDFSVDDIPERADERSRHVMILACASRSYFREPVRRTGARPLLWTTGLMAPEAYVLKAAVEGWILGEGGEQVRRRAAEAYHRYQRCGIRAATGLFATGF